jgi:hypothetical protein
MHVVPSDAPPAFLAAANDHACCSEPIVRLLERYRAAHRPVEAHVFAEWLTDGGWLTPAPSAG